MSDKVDSLKDERLYDDYHFDLAAIIHPSGRHLYSHRILGVKIAAKDKEAAKASLREWADTDVLPSNISSLVSNITWGFEDE